MPRGVRGKYYPPPHPPSHSTGGQKQIPGPCLFCNSYTLPHALLNILDTVNIFSHSEFIKVHKAQFLDFRIAFKRAIHKFCRLFFKSVWPPHRFLVKGVKGGYRAAPPPYRINTVNRPSFSIPSFSLFSSFLSFPSYIYHSFASLLLVNRIIVIL